MKRLSAFPLGLETNMSTVTTLNIMLEVLVSAIKQEREIKTIYFKKEEIKLSFIGRWYNCLCRKLQAVYKKIPRISDSWKVTGYKINMWNQPYFYILAMNVRTHEIKYITAFTITHKTILRRKSNKTCTVGKLQTTKWKK